MHQIPIGSKAPDVINVVIEIPAGSRNKYEYDEEIDAIKLDRVNYAAMAHPYDYGFIPQTRSDDGDHLDAFVLLDHSVFPGCVVEARPVGLLKMIDDGEGDEKIICVPAGDVRYNHIKELSDLSAHLPKEIQHFFEHYKDLQGKTCQITGWADSGEAKAEINKAMKAEAARA
ncbi:MAG TPA: inorganic diphosphatase [Candidatus Saccharimonadales bacterium]|nr:inorganic diphosphatase [Candidatus Saccharimonadales bacterium]